MSKIETIHVRPPVSSTAYDWQAHFPDDEGKGVVGYGATEVDALKDLCQQLRLSSDFWSEQHKELCKVAGSNA